MSVKDVKRYYDQISEQYLEMLQDIRDLEQEAAENIIEPERIERLKDQIAPIKQNYERWSYMMFLLNRPSRKEKHRRYEQQNKRFLKTLNSQNSIDATIEENNIAKRGIGK